MNGGTKSVEERLKHALVKKGLRILLFQTQKKQDKNFKTFAGNRGAIDGRYE